MSADAKQAEVAFLRAEMEQNRKYIFERPIAVVVGAVAAAATLAGGDKTFQGFDLLPTVFTVVLGFNLWFTHNRLQSTARIVSYLQVFHPGDGTRLWMGWEAELHEFRRIQPERRRFYDGIWAFHILAAVASTGLILVQIYPDPDNLLGAGLVQQVAVGVDVAAVFGLLFLAGKLRPSTVRHTIEQTRGVWEQIRQQQTARAAAPPFLAELS